MGIRVHWKRTCFALGTTLLILFDSAPVGLAAATPPEPSVSQAQISIQPRSQGVSDVMERIQLTKVNTAKGGQLVFLFASFANEAIQNLSLRNQAGTMPVTQKKVDSLTKIYVPVASGDTDLSVTIQYTVTSHGESRIPLVVPMYASSATTSAVKLSYTVPSGMYLHSSNPRFGGSDQGLLEQSLVGIPSFTDFSYGPARHWINTETVIGILNLLVILAAIGVWLGYENRRVGGVSNV